MGFDVKKTTKWGLMDWLCPYYCRGCGQLGEALCWCCKNDILTSNLEFRKKYSGPLLVGKKEGLLGQIIKEYKYGPVRGLGKDLADLLWVVLELAVSGNAEEIVIVPLPTISKHIRQRGFDHMWVIGRYLAKVGGYRVEKILRRVNNTVQVGVDREKRLEQARQAYMVEKQVDSKRTYVLVDDIWTTGASMQAAEKELRKAGAKKIIKIVLAVSENDF